MFEANADLWTYKAADWEFAADARVITTNGDVNGAGRAVMGRGCALEASQRYPGIAVFLGELLKRHGNYVYKLGNWSKDGRDGAMLISFPVKDHWHEKAKLTEGVEVRAIIEAFCGALLDLDASRRLRAELQARWAVAPPVPQSIANDAEYNAAMAHAVCLLDVINATTNELHRVMALVRRYEDERSERQLNALDVEPGD